MLLCKFDHCIQPLKAIGSVVDSSGAVANQLKPCPIVRNSMNICKKWRSWTIALLRGQRDRPLNAHVLTTEIPWLAMLARVASTSASEFNTGNQYAFVPTNLILLNYSMSGCWIQRWRSWAYFPLNENSPLSAVTNFPAGRGPLTFVLLVGVGFIADTTRAKKATSPRNDKNMGDAG